ncbi:MAG: folylpolyglutamate synthase/dihydrofolate synthase family protein [Rhodospirillaceae bacterium]
MTQPTGAAARCDAMLDRLLTLHPKVIDLSLERVRRLLATIGHPEAKLPPVFHVAGTNGKGSVMAFLRAMLEAAGYRVHVHISPHLVRFNERVVLAGEQISDEALEALLAECEVANGSLPITFFEITTTAALLAFSRHPADVVLLETGLGGRLDATNVIDRPCVTAITPISLDHQQFLGDTVEKIAAEKAGIMRPGVPCVVGAQMPEVLKVLLDKAAGVGAPVLARGRDWDMEETRSGFRLLFGRDAADYPLPSLAGRHQLANAAQAMMCLNAMAGFVADDDARNQGLAAARWPARLQRLTRGPLVAALPQGWELWLDGGHNQAAGETIAAHARDVWGDRPLHLICGMINSKDPKAFLKPMAGVAADLHGIAIPGEQNTLAAGDIVGAAAAAGIDAREAPSVMAALAEVFQAAGSPSAPGGAPSPAPARVMICGSLYLAGEVLAQNG